MIMQAGLFADVDKKVMERGDAKKASDDYLQQFDPLFKVSLLITNMIATLEAQAGQDATEKACCNSC